MTQRRSIAPGDGFVALPAPAGEPPYRHRLADVIGPAAAKELADAGVIRFHAVGDTGGHGDPRPQRWVAAAMTRELGEPNGPSFFYHLGDVVYPHGEEAHYGSQFFAAYAGYDAPIFAVPGNHDGESPAPSLSGFVKTFCGDEPPLHDASAPLPRPRSRQPHVYWTLVHELVWIVGLYTNVPEGGQLADEQLDWLVGELCAAPRDAVLILAMHQPVYAVDVTHGSNLELADVLAERCEAAGRWPDAVFGGHSHSYQRFALHRDGRSVPHVIAGAGGYPECHRIGTGVHHLPASFPGVEDVTLEAVEDQAYGFMTVTVRSGGADVAYTAVRECSTAVIDTFRIGAGAT